MREDKIVDIPQVSPQENSILTADFTKEEVFEAISQMEHNKVLGLDGFSARVLSVFWGVIKKDLMTMFVQLQRGNFGVITLLTRNENAVQIQQYRPICLLNVSFNIYF
jgi:hypothetical protein